MQVAAGVLNNFDLEAGARAVVQKRLDHFPLLISDACLADAEALIAEHTYATFRAGHRALAETIVMPKRGFGPRPVDVLSVPTRTLYAGVTMRLGDSMPEPSRERGAWDRHRAFGLDGSSDYIVELDVAACYEFIDHRVLLDELVLRSMDVASSEVVNQLLSNLYPRARGDTPNANA